tara:strand:- start:841 stop:2535 length:1695 start_codon:yes stop_codon:yes gene_type:complete
VYNEACYVLQESVRGEGRLNDVSIESAPGIITALFPLLYGAIQSAVYFTRKEDINEINSVKQTATNLLRDIVADKQLQKRTYLLPLTRYPLVGSDATFEAECYNPSEELAQIIEVDEDEGEGVKERDKESPPSEIDFSTPGRVLMRDMSVIIVPLTGRDVLKVLNKSDALDRPENAYYRSEILQELLEVLCKNLSACEKLTVYAQHDCYPSIIYDKFMETEYSSVNEAMECIRALHNSGQSDQSIQLHLKEKLKTFFDNNNLRQALRDVGETENNFLLLELWKSACIYRIRVQNLKPQSEKLDILIEVGFDRLNRAVLLKERKKAQLYLNVLNEGLETDQATEFMFLCVKEIIRQSIDKNFIEDFYRGDSFMCFLHGKRPEFIAGLKQLADCSTQLTAYTLYQILLDKEAPIALSPKELKELILHVVTKKNFSFLHGILYGIEKNAIPDLYRVALLELLAEIKAGDISQVSSPLSEDIAGETQWCINKLTSLVTKESAVNAPKSESERYMIAKQNIEYIINPNLAYTTFTPQRMVYRSSVPSAPVRTDESEHTIRKIKAGWLRQ